MLYMEEVSSLKYDDLGESNQLIKVCKKFSKQTFHSNLFIFFIIFQTNNSYFLKTIHP